MTVIAYSSSKYVTSKPRTSLTEFCLAGIVGFFGAMGTGSSLNPRATLEHAAYVIPLDSKKEEFDSAKKVTYLTISEQIELIKNSFGLNMSAMAELLNISRPTAYAWLKGEPPKNQENIYHTAFVVSQAKIYSELNLERPDNFIKRPLFNGESLFSLLKMGKTISELEYARIKELDLKESQTRAGGLKKNEFRTSDDVLDDLA
ncbi:hypothetical protein [Acinetobacter johnsonii]|uniref:hypothetical protein n=1 Tax=Acinetobacter johnsonii TaxID=40214 RepID=UPI0024469CF5|nr:hypothetical protein [Acinetobacter johnsonii]MDH1799306.1 hypothetical protein [Acinetobacter johnsonii]